MDGVELMAKSLPEYEVEVRRLALLLNRENMAAAYDWLVKQYAYHLYKDDLDRDWDDRCYRESLAKSAYMEGADGLLARRESPTIKEENAHA
jgi:hypothetical protein